MNWDAIKVLVEVFELGCIALIGLWSRNNGKHDAHTKQVQNIKGQFDDLKETTDKLTYGVEELEQHASKRDDMAERLSRLETSIDHMPKIKDIRELSRRIGEVEGDVKATRTAMEQISASNTQLVNYLMDKGR